MTRRLLALERVGRTHELSVLASTFDDPQHGRVIGIVGEAGVGKSALLRAAISRGTRATVALHGRAVPNGQPFRPLAEVAVAALVEGADPDDSSSIVLRSGLASLLPHLGPAAPTEASHPILIAEGLLALVATIGAPVVVVLDDLHWADDDTLSAAERLADRARDRRLALVMATRPASAAGDLLGRLAGRRTAEVLNLAPLTPPEVAAMVASCLGSAAPATLLEALAVAGGRPYEVEELLRSAADARLLCETEGAWSFDPSEAVPIPKTITDVVLARLAQLPPGVARVLASGAVLGPSIPLDVVRTALGLSRSDVDAAIRSGVEAQLLDPDATTIAFRHALTEEAAAKRLLAHERAEVAAAALATLWDDPDRGPADKRVEPSVLATLAATAGDLAAAARWHLAASSRLAEASAVGAALAQIDAALALVDHVDHALLTAIRLARVDLLALAGRASQSLREGEIASAIDDLSIDERGRLLIARARAATSAGHHAAAAGWITEAIETTAGTALSGKASAMAALLAVDRGDRDNAARHARGALKAAGDDVSARCQALEVLGRLARGVDLAEAAERFDQAASLAEAHGLALWRARALHERATIAQLRSLATEDLRVARAAAVEAGAPGLVGSVDFHLSAILSTRFEPVEALEIARRGVALMRTLSNPAMEGWWWILVAYAHIVADPRMVALANAALDKALRLGGESFEVRALALVLRDGLRPLLNGDVQGAETGYRAAARELIDHSTTLTPFPPWYLGPLLSTVVDRDGESMREVASRPELDLSVAVRPARLLSEAVAVGRGGDKKSALAFSQEADTAIERGSGASGLLHLARWLAAEDARRDGWGDPDTWLTATEGWASDQGYAAIVDSCRAGLRRAGVAPRRRRGTTAVPDALMRLKVTGREVDVLTLLAEGFTNAGIAERLHLSPRTVKGYVEQLLAKTGEASRTGLASLAVDHGLRRPSG